MPKAPQAPSTLTMKLVSYLLLTLLSLAPSLLLQGCQSSKPHDNKTFVVTLSPLDILEVYYYPSVTNSKYTAPSRLTLIGTGMISMRTGTSPLLQSDFAAEHDNDQWQDYRTDQTYISDIDMQAIFQSYVNLGMTDPYYQKKRHMPLANARPLVRIKGKMSGHFVSCTSTNDGIIGITELILDIFEK